MCASPRGDGLPTSDVFLRTCQQRALARFPVLAILLLTATSAIGQTTGAATLVGTVTDSSGAFVPAAQVAVVNVETSFRSETQTSPEGSYYVPYLSPGPYQITVEAAGFKRHLRDGVTIRTGEPLRLDILLELGSPTKSITLFPATPLLAADLQPPPHCAE